MGNEDIKFLVTELKKKGKCLNYLTHATILNELKFISKKEKSTISTFYHIGYTVKVGTLLRIFKQSKTNLFCHQI